MQRSTSGACSSVSVPPRRHVSSLRKAVDAVLHQGKGKLATLLNRMDKDGDGVVSREEAAQHAKEAVVALSGNEKAVGKVYMQAAFCLATASFGERTTIRFMAALLFLDGHHSD